jgi:glycerol-3-phosphate dehydrogenase (NAD(P)+)
LDGSPEFEPVAVLGGGAWGTSLAWLLGRSNKEARLWCRDPEHAAGITAHQENRRRLPGIRVPDTVRATADLDAALAGAGAIVLAVPTQGTRAVLRDAAARMLPGAGVIIAAKGLERGTGKRLSEVAAEELGPAVRVAVLSGPNLAAEIVREVPTASVSASTDLEWARDVQQLFSTRTFRIYTNPDLAGVELGGALKNPVAIAAGIAAGLGFGHNTRATLLTRGLAEMTRLGVACGARAATFSGLAGLGDLIATAGSTDSRNFRLGLALGRGEMLDAALAEVSAVAEGVPTTIAACRLADRLGVEVPILRQLHRVLHEGIPARAAVEELLARPFREEG